MGKNIQKEEQEHQEAKSGYWQNELWSIRAKSKELNDNKELENLADNIKQAMFQDYKVAYSEEGDTHEEGAESTITVG